jgi:hypothetical protein
MSKQSTEFFEEIHGSSLRRDSAPTVRIIGGNRYDVARADEIADFKGIDNSFGIDHNGLTDWVTESLYRTSSDNYFLLYEGGALSCHGFFVDECGCTPGGGLCPISREVAMAWCDLRELDDVAAKIGEGLVQDA